MDQAPVIVVRALAVDGTAGYLERLRRLRAGHLSLRSQDVGTRL
ncbi:hypothetical protein [Streptomyces sp. NPDC059881]